MGQELATRTGGGYLATSDDYYAALAAEAQSLKGGGGGKAFMKFDGNTGDYSYGAEDEPLNNGQQLLMDPRSYMRGWVIWLDGEVVHEDMRPLGQDAVSKHQLPDKGPYGEDDGPVEQYTLDFFIDDEPFTGMVFQANNVSKRRALAALLKDFANTFRMHPGMVPVIELGSREFEAKVGKRKVIKHAPSFKIVDWAPEADLSRGEGAQEDYADESEPAAKQVEDKRSVGGSRTRSAEDTDERPARRTRSAPAEEAEPAAEPEERTTRASRTSTRDAEPAEPEERTTRASRTRAEPEPEPESEPAARTGRASSRAAEPEEREERTSRASTRAAEPEAAPAAEGGRRRAGRF